MNGEGFCGSQIGQMCVLNMNCLSTMFWETSVGMGCNFEIL